MNHDRLHALSDGIFAIAMTLLVFQIKVPSVDVSNYHAIWHSLVELFPVFASFVLSFAILFTYWRSHNFVVSNLAQNIDVAITNINALFLFFVVLVPFSAEFLGLYYRSEFGIALYGLNIIAISTTLIYMRSYILTAEHIENKDWTEQELSNGFIRMAFPSVTAALAILVGFVNKDAALGFFILGILFNFSRSSTHVAKKAIYAMKRTE
ncbi:MAG TPA: TMEM175 family protein [Candidatus Saccharimonadales bacterium]